MSQSTLHGKRVNVDGMSQQSRYGCESQQVDDRMVLLGTRMKTLCDRIPDSEVITPQLLKKYIQYARHTDFPKLSIEACEVLKKFYIQLRENSTNSQNTLPITSRALDSLIRLTQARAKLELRTIVSQDDAIDVMKLV